MTRNINDMFARLQKGMQPSLGIDQSISGQFVEMVRGFLGQMQQQRPMVMLFRFTISPDIIGQRGENPLIQELNPYELTRSQGTQEQLSIAQLTRTTLFGNQRVKENRKDTGIPILGNGSEPIRSSRNPKEFGAFTFDQLLIKLLQEGYIISGLRIFMKNFQRGKKSESNWQIEVEFTEVPQGGIERSVVEDEQFQALQWLTSGEYAGPFRCFIWLNPVIARETLLELNTPKAAEAFMEEALKNTAHFKANQLQTLATFNAKLIKKERHKPVLPEDAWDGDMLNYIPFIL